MEALRQMLGVGDDEAIVEADQHDPHRAALRARGRGATSPRAVSSSSSTMAAAAWPLHVGSSRL